MQQKIIDFISTYRLALFILFCALLGLWASLGLIVDQVNLLSNEKLFIECNINPIISCVKVMETEYANLFGIPNPVWGLIGYSAVATFSIFLMAIRKLPKFIMISGLIFAFSAYLFSYILIAIGMFLINALCPLCLLSAFAATNIFFSFLYLNFHQKNLPAKLLEVGWLQKLFVAKNYPYVVIAWFVLVFLAIYAKYPTILTF